MKAPTPSQLSKWWDNQPSGDYTCTDCGKTDSKSFVQPQHPFFADGHNDVARCADCTSARNRVIDRDRKAELAALPRCEICNRRGAWKVGHEHVLLCGHHKGKALREYQRRYAGPFWIPGPNLSRVETLELARA